VKMDYPTRLDFCDGKYTVIYDFSTGQSECLRYGQPWRQLVGDKMVLAMFDRVVELQAEVAAAQAVIEQKNEALKVITRRANCLDVLEIARTANEALTLQPCTEVLNKVRADAVAEYVAAATANQHTHQCRRCLNPYTALSENEDCPFCGCTDAEAKAILAQRIEQGEA